MNETSTLNPTILMEAIEIVDSLLEQMNEREQDCLRRVFLRMCLIKSLIGADFKKHVKRKDFDHDKNYCEWYYQVGNRQPYLLMTRRINATAKDGIPSFSMDITFNGELAVNNEL